MMRNLFFISILFVFFSCEKKDYDLKVNTVDPILIVDARVESHTQIARVKLTRSTDFLGDNPEDFVNDALVFLSVNGGEEVQLSFTDSGSYQLENVLVTEETEYDLRIVDGQNEYTSSSKMLNVVPVSYFPTSESLTIGQDLEDSAKYYSFDMLVNIDLTKTNYYITEAEVTLNTNPEFFTNKDSYLPWNDEAYDSNPAFFPYFVSEFPLYSEVNVRFSHINQESYDFYESLNEVGGQSPSSIAPSNPTGNISNGAIGTFGAFATFDTTIVIYP